MFETPCLYFVTERSAKRDWKQSHLAGAKAALEGGAGAIQLRDKHATDAELLPVAIAIRKLCEKQKAAFIINDRLGLAKKSGATGVHVGQEDLVDSSVAGVRAKVFPHAIVGVTAHNVAEALLAFEEGADYLGVSPIFATKSKDDAGKPIGLKGLKEIALALERRGARIPIIAIGGITEKNAASVMKAGADGVAVVSAISRAKNPQTAAKRLAGIISGKAINAKKW
ncbi:MAG: thiamine phosphate synthase [Candidatus Micrarchaeia archaeon]